MTFIGQVISVQDGDTITVRTSDFEQIRVRFYGVDSPEKDQAYGKEARAFLNKIVYGKTVELEVMDIDRYSRYVCLVNMDGTLLNLVMVANGFAWTYDDYCKDRAICEKFRDAEDQAQNQRFGLWSDPNALPPWAHRKAKRKR
jgi:endonuclease YncB( thermonuclease family)